MGILTQSFGSCCAAIDILEFDDLRQLPDSVHLQFQNKVVFWMMLMLMRATWLEGRGRAGAKSFKRKVKWNFQKGLRLQHDDNSEGCGQPILGGTGKEKLKTLVCDEKVFGAKGVVLTLYWCLLTLHWTASDLLCVWTIENSWEQPKLHVWRLDGRRTGHYQARASLLESGANKRKRHIWPKVQHKYRWRRMCTVREIYCVCIFPVKSIYVSMFSEATKFCSNDALWYFWEYVREEFNNPSHGNFPLGGSPPPPGPSRTKFSRKVNRNFLTEKGGTLPPPLKDGPLPKR